MPGVLDEAAFVRVVHGLGAETDAGRRSGGRHGVR